MTGSFSESSKRKRKGDFMGGALKIESYEDIENLWENRIEESTRLEFKREIDTNNKEIAKDISAMANAEGGFIIYGLEEDNGRAKFSSGMVKKRGSAERLQQVIESHIHPPLTVKILSVEAKNEKGEILEDKEFLVVKIPQSLYHIHQVETAGRFYIRSNRNIRRMNEVEIERRYEMRFRERVEQENLFERKKTELRNRQNILHSCMFCGSIPHLRYGTPVEVTEELFRSLMFMGTRYQGTYLYHKISSFTFLNYPREGGRFAEGEKTKEYLEINNDKSMFLLCPISSQSQLFLDCFFLFVDFLSVTKNFYTTIGYDGGLTIILKFDNIKGMMKPTSMNYPANIIEREPGRIKEESIEIKINLESILFNLKDISIRFFEEFWKRLQIDNPFEVRSKEAEYLESWICQIERSLARIS